jgi:DNA (cytosine-5)-methyltransferase 1
MKSLEIFSGAGGLAKGLELTGFEHASFVEFNKDACRSLRLNFNPEIVFEGDIADFDLRTLKNVDLVAGGPPCQPFSLGGKHKSHQDHRDMFPYAIRAIEELQPKAFIFENVKGLLRPSFKEYFNYIILRLTYPHCEILKNEAWSQHIGRLKELTSKSYDGTRYKVIFKLLNAANYGVPQKRERVVIVGIRSDLDVEWKFPEFTHSEDRLNWEKYVTGQYWERHGIPVQHDDKLARLLEIKYGIYPPEEKPWMTVRDCLVNVPHPLALHNIEDHVFKDGARVYSGHTGSEIDQPSKTIKAGGHGVPGGENMIRYEDGTVRYFTVYEAKLIQTFPENFVITGSWGEAMRQIGNAVPVKLAKTIGSHLYKTINSSLNIEQKQPDTLSFGNPLKKGSGEWFTNETAQSNRAI